MADITSMCDIALMTDIDDRRMSLMWSLCDMAEPNVSVNGNAPIFLSATNGRSHPV
jgi:hypothetical protein